MVIALPPATVPPVAIFPSPVVSHATPAPHGWSAYTVRPGDTLIGLAATYRTTPRALAAHNGLREARSLWAGSTIQVPGRAGSTAKAAPRSTARTLGTHRVRAGETLSSIADRYSTTITSIAKANGMSPRSFIFPGQTLRLSATSKASRGTGTGTTSTKASQRTASGTAYRVRAGDTLLGVASRHDRTVSALVKANGLRGTTIYAGQRLVIPAPATRKANASNSFFGVRYPDKVVANAARNRDILRTRSVPTRAQTKAMVAATARRHGVDPKLALAIAMQESGWNQRQVSVANAVGIMQVIPSGGEWASSLIGRRLNLLDAQDNVTAGVVMLRALTRSAPTQDIAIAGYYQGLSSVRSRGMYTDTKRYVAGIKALQGRM